MSLLPKRLAAAVILAVIAIVALTVALLTSGCAAPPAVIFRSAAPPDCPCECEPPQYAESISPSNGAGMPTVRSGAGASLSSLNESLSAASPFAAGPLDLGHRAARPSRPARAAGGGFSGAARVGYGAAR